MLHICLFIFIDAHVTFRVIWFYMSSHEHEKTISKYDQTRLNIDEILKKNTSIEIKSIVRIKLNHLYYEIYNCIQ